MCRERFSRHFVKPRPDCLGNTCPHHVWGHSTVKNETASLFVLDGFCKQVVQFQDLDATFLHLENKVIVILLRLLDPKNVVEKQRVTITRSQTLMRKSRTAHQHSSQFTYFGVHAKLVQNYSLRIRHTCISI